MADTIHNQWLRQIALEAGNRHDNKKQHVESETDNRHDNQKQHDNFRQKKAHFL